MYKAQLQASWLNTNCWKTYMGNVSPAKGSANHINHTSLLDIMTRSLTSAAAAVQLGQEHTHVLLIGQQSSSSTIQPSTLHGQ